MLLLLFAVSTQLVDVTTLDARLRLDIKYATTDNFTQKQLYPVARCLLRPKVSRMLLRAQRHLDRKHPGFVLLLKDCYRPQHIQELMWRTVKGTPQVRYVANPYSKTGSVHTYGAAVDLSLADSAGNEVDMGTPYDTFSKLAEPRHEARFVREGKLTRAQVGNRLILRDAMLRGGGFLMIKNEWWHFDALRGRALRRAYKRLDVPLGTALSTD